MTTFDLVQLETTLFSKKKWPTNQWPNFLGIKYSDESNDKQTIIEIDCFIPQSLAWFKGHYPDQPVLPGVVQTHWVTELSQILFNIKDFQGINALKFINMILPETPLKLILKFSKATNSVSFTFINKANEDAIKCSAGKVVFA